jgi:hypothetical protein
VSLALILPSLALRQVALDVPGLLHLSQFML